MGPQIEKSIWDQSGINPGFNPGGSWIVNLGPRLKSIWVLDCQSGSWIVNLGPRLTSIWVLDCQSGSQIDNPGPPRLKNQSGINLGSIRDSILEGGIPDLSYLLRCSMNILISPMTGWVNIFIPISPSIWSMCIPYWYDVQFVGIKAVKISMVWERWVG